MTADMCGEWAELLAGLTIDEVAAERGAGSAEWEQSVDLAIAARRARDARAPRGRPGGYAAGDSATWYLAAHAQFLQAEHELAGCLVNRRGRAAGIEPMTLWTGPRHVADAYASEELQEFWTAHPRLTGTEYRRQAAPDRPAEARQHRGRGRGHG